MVSGLLDFWSFWVSGNLRIEPMETSGNPEFFFAILLMVNIRVVCDSDYTSCYQWRHVRSSLLPLLYIHDPSYEDGQVTGLRSSFPFQVAETLIINTAILIKRKKATYYSDVSFFVPRNKFIRFATITGVLLIDNHTFLFNCMDGFLK